MAELVSNGRRSYVQLSAYEAAILESWGQRDKVIQAARERAEQDASRLQREIAQFLQRKEIKPR